MKISKSTLLTIGACTGVVLTALAASYGGLKVHEVLQNKELEKKDVFKASAKYYIPAIISASATMACIIANQKINKAEIASIISASGLSAGLITKYRNAIRDKYGEEGLSDVEAMIAQSEPVNMYAPGLISLSKGLPVNGEVVLFHDQYTDKWFESTIPQVLQAEYHLNRNYILKADGVCLADWLEFLGLENDIPDSDKLGWDAYEYDGISWLDFDHTKVNKEGGGYYYEITMVFPPEVETIYD